MPSEQLGGEVGIPRRGGVEYGAVLGPAHLPVPGSPEAQAVSLGVVEELGDLGADPGAGAVGKPSVKRPAAVS